MTPEEREAAFAELAARVRRKATVEIKKHQRLLANLRSDLEKHGDPENWKKLGDLLLANPSAERREERILLVDYFTEGSPILEVEGERNLPISEIAESYFRRYTKARNAQAVIADRMKATEDKLMKATDHLHQIDAAIAGENTEFLERLIAPPKKPIAVLRKKRQDVEFKGARRFVSEDGFEILVGKKAADNDLLTFRVAKSLDTWLHAADYPGSHVVIRSAGRREIPDRTLLQAAELAAFYSDAREQPKAAVNYTLKKFVNKPKRAAPGLVSLSSFKTILVVPKVADGLSLL